jgi:hypothetical protein
MRSFCLYISFFFIFSVSFQAQEVDTTSSSRSAWETFLDLIDVPMGRDMVSGRSSAKASDGTICLWCNKELASYLDQFTKTTRIGVGITSRMTGTNQFSGLFDVKSPRGTHEEGVATLLLRLHFEQSEEDERQYRIKIDSVIGIGVNSSIPMR